MGEMTEDQEWAAAHQRLAERDKAARERVAEVLERMPANAMTCSCGHWACADSAAEVLRMFANHDCPNDDPAVAMIGSGSTRRAAALDLVARLRGGRTISASDAVRAANVLTGYIERDEVPTPVGRKAGSGPAFSDVPERVEVAVGPPRTQGGEWVRIPGADLEITYRLADSPGTFWIRAADREGQ